MVSLLLVSGSLLGAPVNVAKEISAIRRAYGSIQSQKHKFSQLERTVFGRSTEGTSIVAYRDATGSVRKIIVTDMGEIGQAVTEYFFQGEKLFFVFRQSIRYGGHIMDTLNGKALQSNVAAEDRLYFSKGELIRWLKFKKQVPAMDPEFAVERKTVLDDAKTFLLLMKTPAPKGGENLCSWHCATGNNGVCKRFACE